MGEARASTAHSEPHGSGVQPKHMTLPDARIVARPRATDARTAP